MSDRGVEGSQSVGTRLRPPEVLAYRDQTQVHGAEPEESSHMRSCSLVSRPTLRFLAAVPLLLAVAGCSTEPDIPEFFDVTYSLTNTSVGSVTEVTYIDDLRVTRTVVDPPEGWEVNYLLPAGNPIAATAEATVQSGEITLEIHVVGVFVEFTRSDSCEDLTDQPVACSLEIPRETL